MSLDPLVWLQTLVVLGGLVGCDRVFGLSRDEEYCGNGLLAQEEDCDDGSNAAGDGCGPSCEIE
ncbi:MAG: hypothetical protein ACKV2T_18145, partial [Kofleriaceae bacterium]